MILGQILSNLGAARLATCVTREILGHPDGSNIAHANWPLSGAGGAVGIFSALRISRMGFGLR